MTSTHQELAFVNGLGDDWYNRNKSDLGKGADPVEQLFAKHQFKPSYILEVGCANGWRVKKVAAMCGAKAYGVDPSEAAIADAGYGFAVGTARNLPFPDDSMDCVIMGFCMWALDPRDWFSAVAECDRVLMDGGHVIIHDRHSPRPTMRKYPERDDIYGYSYDWRQLWLSHPAYREVAECLGIYPGTLTIEGSVMLQKNVFGRILRVDEPSK